MTLSALKKFTGKPRDADIIPRAFARCFTSGDGQLVLEQLHHQTLFRVIDPQASAEQLRFVEGQRQLVLWLCQMIAKGQTN